MVITTLADWVQSLAALVEFRPRRSLYEKGERRRESLYVANVEGVAAGSAMETPSSHARPSLEVKSGGQDGAARHPPSVDRLEGW
jgi:hypothetical protein